MFPNSVARMREYYEESVRNTTRVLLGIYDNSSGSHIGNITLQQINWVNRSASVAYLIGDRSFAGRGIATEAVRMVMYYGFNRLNLERLHAGVSARHHASRRVLEKSGMREEGRLRGALLRNGERTDVILFGGLRDEWLAELGDAVRGMFVVPPTY
jgi:RimJ/RimL family protein N-acetyltransferase